MGRAILAVILGYLAMSVVVFVIFAGAYAEMGADGAFEPGSYEPSGLWLLMMFVFSFIAALLGGLVCTVIAKSPTPALVLAGLVLVLGLLMAIPVFTSTDEVPALRAGEVGMFEAMNNAQQPVWVALLNPLLGAVGVLVGSKLKRQK